MEFFRAGLQIVCIQETCLRASTTRRQHHFTSFSSSATEDGRLGVAIWVSNYLLLQCKAKVIPLSPRLMSVLLDGPIRIKVTCAHAPVEGSPPCEAADFWSTFNLHLANTCRRRWHLIGIDANARLGTPESRLIGGPLLEHESQNGTRLRCALEEHRLAA
eukprot:12939320-Heterocapsa_arctica.AAC.1